MRLNDCLTEGDVLTWLAEKKRRTTSDKRKRLFDDMATARFMALRGIDWQVPNPADEYGFTADPDKAPAAEPIPLSCLEDMARRGYDDAELDEQLPPTFDRTDNHNPADFDYDNPHEFVLRVERDGFYTKTTQVGIVTDTRQEPVRVKKRWLWQGDLWAIARQEAGHSIPTTETAELPPPVKPVPAVNRKGDRLTPPPAIVAEQAAAAVVRLMSTDLGVFESLVRQETARRLWSPVPRAPLTITAPGKLVLNA